MSAVDSFITQRLTFSRVTFSVFAVAAEALAILGTSVLVGIFCNYLANGNVGEITHYLGVGTLLAAGFALPFLLRDDYRVEAIIEGRRQLRRLWLFWTCSFLALPLIGFLTRSSEEFSHGWLIALYLVGFVVILAADAFVRHALISLIEAGRIERRKLMVVSVDQDVRPAAREMMGKGSCAEVAAVVKLDSKPGLTGTVEYTPADLENAVSWARSLNIDDIVVLADWSRSGNIDQIVNAFTVLPVAIHVGAASVLGRFASAHVSRVGETTVLSLKGRPLEPGQAMMKRAFDVVASGCALLLLLPLFAVIMLAIRLDSSGPALFLQRRRGYNQRVFQIWKFRTMTVMDDGDNIVQALRNDTRITRIGGFLRRYNLDELPQLVNVLRGEMSLVGPRPHAVAHDRVYEVSILQYQRRLNMRPGITGWAQVNGFRGKTDTDRDMAQRLDYDLHYIDNWSLGLDFYILVLTVLSPRAYRNAH